MGAWGVCWACGASECHCIPLHFLGQRKSYTEALAYLQDHSSLFQLHCLEPFAS